MRKLLFILSVSIISLFLPKCNNEEKKVTQKRKVVYHNQLKSMTREETIKEFGIDPDTINWERSDKELKEYLNADNDKLFKMAEKGKKDYTKSVDKKVKEEHPF